MEPTRQTRVDPGAALTLGAAVLLVGVLLTWIVQLVAAPVNTDAGLYVPHARLVLEGKLPYRDFPSGYAPGIYYLLAMLGPEGLRTPLAFKGLVFAAQLGNGALVYAILRRLGHGLGLALLFTACFAGLATAAWAMAFQLEPFLNLCVLGAFALLLGPPHPARGAAAGLLLGAGLMIKQTALFAVAPLALVCVTPLAGPPAPPRLGGGRGPQLATLLACAPLPYLAFATASGLPPVATLLHLASFGGRASSYGAAGLGPLLSEAVSGEVGRFLAPAALFAAWLLLCERSWRSVALVLALATASAPLYTRTFPYYFQVPIPWAVIVMAEFAERVGARFDERRTATALAAVLVALPLLPIVGSALRASVPPPTTLAEQRELAALLEEEIGASQDVLILNGSWLYTLTRFEPPLDDYSFNIDPATAGLRRSRTRFAILISGQGPVAQARAWLEEGGMSLRRRIRWEGRTVWVLDREAR